MSSRHHLLVFGGSGAIGGAVVHAALARGWQVTSASRSMPDPVPANINFLAMDPLASHSFQDGLAAFAPYSSVCWAQGANANDSIYDFDLDQHDAIYRANCTYILVTLNALLKHGLLAPNSRLCVISSIWQNLARQSKLSYCMSKAALQGLVLSASADLGKDGHLINAVLPGALDTPMTRRNLTAEQVETLSQATEHKRLVTLDEVASLTCFLCSAENSGVTGQFIAADLGFSRVRLL